MAKEEQNAPATPEDKKSKVVLFIVIGVGVLLVLLLAIIAMLVFPSNDSNQAVQSQVQEQSQVRPNAPKIVVGDTITARSTDYAKIGPIFPIQQEFKVNLLTQTGKKILLTNISLELDKPETQPEVETKLPMLFDAIIEILSSKSVEEIITTKGKNRLKDEIVRRLNEFLIDGSIKNVFFTNFLIG
ncbi:MAG: flagellar basal body-associated protein FliL [Helicobacter sp.]|nr:flagellar basal body-associated protein FliL [Helicobacter sp.]